MEISNMTSLNVKEAKTGHNVDIPLRFGAASSRGLIDLRNVWLPNPPPQVEESIALRTTTEASSW